MTASKSSLTLIMFILIITFFGFGMIIPVLPEIVSAAHLALLLAVYSGVSFLMSPLWGAWSDRIGRKPILMIGTIGFSLSFLIFGLAIDSLIWMYVSRILGGVFSGALTACAVAYVADVTDEDNRTKGMGLVGMSIGIGFIFGPAVGGLLSVFGYSVPFFLSSSLSFLTFVFIWRYLRESLTQAARQSQQNRTLGSRWQAFQGKMKYLFTLGFVVSFTLAGLEAVLLYFQREQFGATAVDFGWMMLVSGVVGAGVQGGFVRRYIQKGDEGKYIVFGLVISALGFFLLLLSNSFVTACLYLSVFSVGNAFMRPCVTSLITQKTTTSQGIATGLSSSMDSLGRVLGPLLAASLYYIHSNLPFIVGGIICMLSLLLIFRFARLDQASKMGEQGM